MTAPQADRETAQLRLDQVIREQLAQVYQRGIDTAPHGVNALHDPHAAESYGIIRMAVQAYAEALLTDLSDRMQAIFYGKRK